MSLQHQLDTVLKKVETPAEGPGLILGFGNPLLDTSAIVHPAFLDKYQVGKALLP